MITEDVNAIQQKVALTVRLCAPTLLGPLTAAAAKDTALIRMTTKHASVSYSSRTGTEMQDCVHCKYMIEGNHVGVLQTLYLALLH